MAEITPAYGGRALISFHPGKHYYTVDVPGVIERLYQPGVTSVIGMKDKPALVPWAAKMGIRRVKEIVATVTTPAVEKTVLNAMLNAAEDSWRDAKDEAANIGSLVHRVLEQALLGKFNASMLPLKADALLAPDLTPEMVDQANKAIGAGLKFFGKHHIEVIETEQPRWSPTWGYIGTGDLIAKIDGSRDILDFKSSSGIYMEMFIQTAAYQMAFQEEHPDQPINRRWIVRVGKDGKLMDATRDNATLAEDFLCFRALLAVWKWERVNGRWPKEPITVLGNLDQAIARAQKGAA